MERLNLLPASLLGFKAAPGTSSQQLFAHTTKQQLLQGKDWAGIYVQLDLCSAFRYLPNQFDQGHSDTCILRLTLKPESTMKILLCFEGFMGNNKLSSEEKANMLRNIISQDQQLSQELSSNSSLNLPLLDMLESSGYALCLVDCDSYELAVPHGLFNEQHLEASTLFLCQESVGIQ